MSLPEVRSNKICTVCGCDCALQTRFQDPSGKYYCQPCYVKLSATGQPVVAGGSVPLAPARGPEGRLAVTHSPPAAAVISPARAMVAQERAGFGRMGTELAGRGRRLCAVLVDGILLAGLLFIGGMSMGMGGPQREGGEGMGILVAVVGLVTLVIVQFVLMVREGQTLGKKALGIRIVSNDYEDVPGFVSVILLRTFLFNFLYAIPGIGQLFHLVDILFIFREDRRCIHDMVANTKVITC